MGLGSAPDQLRDTGIFEHRMLGSPDFENNTAVELRNINTDHRRFPCCPGVPRAFPELRELQVASITEIPQSFWVHSNF